MNYFLLTLFFFTVMLGQLGAISLADNVKLYSFDVMMIVLALNVMRTYRDKAMHIFLAAPICAFGAASALSLVANAYRFSAPEVLVSALYTVRWCAYAALVWIVTYSPLGHATWLYGLYATGVGIAAMGLVQYFWYPYLRNLSYLGWDPHLYRVFSTVLDPNYAAIIFVLTLFLGWYLTYAERHRWVVLSGQIVILCALFLTYSRSGYLAFIAGVIGLTWILKKVRLAIFIVSGFLLLLFFLPRPDGEGVRLLRTASTFARIGNWNRGILLIREAPVFGHGFNTLRYVQRARGWIDERQTVSKAGAGLDNSFLFIWASTGVVGFGMYMWLVGRMREMCLKLLATPSRVRFGATVIASLVAVMVHSLFSNSLFFPTVMIWIWIFAGAMERMLSSGTIRGGRR